jgi:hypothetical protein
MEKEQEDAIVVDVKLDAIDAKLDVILAFIDEARPILDALKGMAENPMLQAFLPAGMNGG